MKEKIFVVISKDDEGVLESICLDKDPQEALRFVLERIVPQVKKHRPCLEGKMGMSMK